MDIKNHHLPIENYNPSKQCQPSHYQKYQHNIDSKYKEGCCRRNEYSKSTIVDQDSPGGSQKKCYERTQQQITQPPTDHPQVKWSRNNIAMTMEYFEPISSTSTPKRYSSQTDYSYAYYEPGAAMRHSNVPKMLTTDQPNGQSARSSPKSIRSLLSKPKTDKTERSNRHSYTTRYGTRENIYEDVSSFGQRPDLESSSQSLNTQGCSKIEFQDILQNHYRVLEELNLSVEEMLLSTTTKKNILTPRKILKRSTKPSKPRTKARNSDIISSKNAYPSSMNGEDSGFSGSSSGASYIGSLRNYKTSLTRSHRSSTEISTSNNLSGCGTVPEKVGVVKLPNDSRNVSQGDKCLSKGLKFPFWNKR